MRSTHPFHEALAGAMQTGGFTYRGLAAESGLSAGYLCRLAHGNRPAPDNTVTTAIARALDVEPDYFLEHRLGRVVAELQVRPDLVDTLYDDLTARDSRKAAA